MASSFGDRSTHTMELEAREIPKLGGSVAGFITLIIVLCIVILVSLTGIVFMLRDDIMPDEEIQRKPHRPRTTTYVAPLEDGRASRSSWLRRTYQRLTTSRNDSIPRNKEGSHQARSFAVVRGEWRSSCETPNDLHLKTQVTHIRQHSQLDKCRRSDTGHRLSNPSSTSTCSVRFDLNNSQPLDRDRYAPSPTSTLPNIHTQLSSPASSPPGSPSPPRLSWAVSQEGPVSPQSIQSTTYDLSHHTPIRHSSVPSLATFEGGTKFLEAL